MSSRPRPAAEPATKVSRSSELSTDAVRSALMARVRQAGTGPELRVAAALRMAGHGYRKNVRRLPGTPDFANGRRKWVVFVNGCYWHHHRCPKGTVPTRNREFWLAKFRNNRSRDARAIRRLRVAGFRVMLVWECETLLQHRLDRKLVRLPGCPKPGARTATERECRLGARGRPRPQPPRGDPPLPK